MFRSEELLFILFKKMSMKLKSCLRNLTKSNDFNRKFKVCINKDYVCL